MTKQRLINLLKEMKANTLRVSEHFAKQNDEVSSKRYLSESYALDEVIMILENEEMFKKFEEIYFEKGSN